MSRYNPKLDVTLDNKVAIWWVCIGPRTYKNRLGERIKLVHYTEEVGAPWGFVYVTGPKNAYGGDATDSSDAEWCGQVLSGGDWDTKQDALSTLQYAPSITHIELRRDSQGEQRDARCLPLSGDELNNYPHDTLAYGNRILAERFFPVGSQAQRVATRGRKNPRSASYVAARNGDWGATPPGWTHYRYNGLNFWCHEKREDVSIWETGDRLTVYVEDPPKANNRAYPAQTFTSLADASRYALRYPRITKSPKKSRSS